MNNLNAIRLNNSTNDNPVDKKFYYGRVFQKDNTGKLFDFMVTNHMEEGKKYKFRYTSKCKAGFVTICETNYETTPEQFIGSTYGFLENVQVWIESENPTDTTQRYLVECSNNKREKVL